MWTGSSSTFSSGRTGIEYQYDAFGRLALVRESRRNGASLGTPAETSYGYNFAGELKNVTVSQGSVLRYTDYEYDAERGWLTRMTNKTSSAGSVLSDFQYTRRNDGQIASVSESVNQPSGTETTTNTYTYDALNRLTKEEVSTSTASGDYTIDYKLDLVGNRVKLTKTLEGGAVERTDSTYDTRDRLLTEKIYNAATSGTLQDTISYGYDVNGSLIIRQSTSGSKTEQGWDLRGRMTSASVSQLQTGIWVVQNTASYQYTVDGIRSSVTENSATTNYTVDSLSPSGYAQVVEELASGVLVASYVYGAGLDPISMNRDMNSSPSTLESSLYLADGHSGVRQLLAAVGGAVLAAYRYDAFGNKVGDVGTIVNPIGYRGERFDTTLGQYYLRARFYDPRSGRFTGMDPFAGTYGDPLQAMRYGYAGENPVLNADPNGKFLITMAIASLLGSNMRSANAAAYSSILGKAYAWSKFAVLWTIAGYELLAVEVSVAVTLMEEYSRRNVTGVGGKNIKNTLLNTINDKLKPWWDKLSDKQSDDLTSFDIEKFMYPSSLYSYNGWDIGKLKADVGSQQVDFGTGPNWAPRSVTVGDNVYYAHEVNYFLFGAANALASLRNTPHSRTISKQWMAAWVIGYRMFGLGDASHSSISNDGSSYGRMAWAMAGWDYIKTGVFTPPTTYSLSKATPSSDNQYVGDVAFHFQIGGTDL